MSTLDATLAVVRTWWELWLVVVVGVTAATVAPLFVTYGQQTRPLTPAERNALTAADVPPDRVRVLTSSRISAFAAGVSPATGRVFLTERLAAELSTDEFAAVACHEYAHLARRHVPIRLALPVGFAAGWVAVTTLSTLAPFLVGVGLLVPTVVGSVVVGRWSEFDADRFADSRTGGRRLAAALGRLADAGHLGGGSLLHPRLSARLSRLGDADPTGSDSN